MPRKKEGTFRDCVVCHISFYKPPSHTKIWPARTCSRKCAAVLKSTQVERLCEQCGETFKRRPYIVAQGYAKFCSNDCQGLAERGVNFFPKLELFSDANRSQWIEKECRRCGSTENLQLDHIIPRFAGGKATRENAQTLCQPCNSKKHWKEDRPKYLVILKSVG